MRPLAEGISSETVREALESQSSLLEEAVIFHKFLRLEEGHDPASGRAAKPVFSREHRRAAVGMPTQADLQLYAGLYQNGDVAVHTRYPIRESKDVDGTGGDQFEFWGERWRIVGLVRPGRLGGDRVKWKALVRRI